MKRNAKRAAANAKTESKRVAKSESKKPKTECSAEKAEASSVPDLMFDDTSSLHDVIVIDDESSDSLGATYPPPGMIYIQGTTSVYYSMIIDGMTEDHCSVPYYAKYNTNK